MPSNVGIPTSIFQAQGRHLSSPYLGINSPQSGIVCHAQATVKRAKATMKWEPSDREVGARRPWSGGQATDKKGLKMFRGTVDQVLDTTSSTDQRLVC